MRQDILFIFFSTIRDRKQSKYIYKFRQRDPILVSLIRIRYTFAGLPVHVSDQFTEPVFPFNIRLGLYPLVGVTHHGNQ